MTDKELAAKLAAAAVAEIDFLDSALARARFTEGRAAGALLTLAAFQMQRSGIFSREDFLRVAGGLYDLSVELQGAPRRPS